MFNQFVFGGYVSEHQTTGIGVSEAKYIYLRFDSEGDSISTLDELTAWLKSNVANGNPTTVIYPLAIPKETDLSDEQLEAFASMKSHKGITNVLTDDIGDITVDYVGDLKTYIDKKIAESVSG